MSVIVRDVSKIFDSGKCALKDIDINIENGVLGIIGYNLSGKSTLIKIITSLMEPTIGSVELFGETIDNKDRMGDIIGYLPQKFSFYENYSIDDLMNYMAKLYRIDRSKRKAHIHEILNKLGLYESKDLKFYELNACMKKRVGIAQAILKSPRLLALDDPLSCMGDEEKSMVKKVLKDYGKDNIVIISSRSPKDIEDLASEIAIMHKGRLCFSGSKDKLIAKAKGSVWMSNIGEYLELSRLKNIHKVVSFNKLEGEYYARVIADYRPYKESVLVEASLEDAFLYSIYTSEELVNL